MNAEGFKNWLLASGMKETAAQNRVANCATVERGQHVDLDVCYEKDRCRSLIELLTYSREDQRRNRPPRHNIPIEGNVYNGTATYKAAVKKYVAFRDAEGKVQSGSSSPRKVFPKAKAGTSASITIAEKKVPSADFKKVLRDFRKWLIDAAELTPNSADQYKTYLNKLRAAADKHFGRGWFESLPSKYVRNRSEQDLRQCSAFVEESIRNAPRSERKAWKDWRSAFHGFEGYLHDIADVYNFDSENAWKNKVRKPGGTTKTAKASPEKKGGAKGPIIATYSDKELHRVFMGRLKTQSRYYPKIELLFPTRLLTKIFKRCKRNPWIEWLKRDLANMRILMSNGGVALFSEVQQIEICGGGTVLITKKDGTAFEMMTHTADGKKIEKEFVERGLRDVSIDHVEPLEKVLRKNKDALRGLRRLTELFFEFEKVIGHKLNSRAEMNWVNDLYDHFRRELDTDEIRALIVHDLENLKLEYELMDTGYNSMKGKGDAVRD